VEFAAFLILLFGARSAKSLDSKNTTLTIGAGMLILSALLAGWLDWAIGSEYPVRFLTLLQGVWLPVAIVLLKTRYSGERGIGAFGSSLHLLLAAQLPGAAGTLLTVSMMVGFVTSWLYAVAPILILSITVSLISLVLSLCFIRSPQRTLARTLGIVHTVYLLGLFLTIAFMMASHGRGPRF
jgi:hypothetical protein